MNKFRQIIIHLMILLPQMLFAQEYVAILEFEGSGMSTNDARNITQTFSYELSRTNKFKIIERQQLDQIIDEQKMQLSGCVADECAVEVGRLAGARYVIAGTVTKTFGLYGIAVRLIDVETAEIITHILENGEKDVQVFISQRVRNAALKMAAEGGSTNQSGSADVTVSNEEKGTVKFVLSKANAAIYVDGVYTTDVSGISVSMKLTAGAHTIKFGLSGYKDVEKNVNVLSGETINDSIGFMSGVSSSGGAAAPSEFGIVVVRSDPGSATVYLDGVELGMTPAQNTKIGTGKHRVRVEKPLYHPYVEDITITSDGIVEVMADLKPAYGHLLIKSDPTGAVVQLNGQQKGRTPLDLPELASGDYRIMLSKDLYHIAEEHYTVTDNSDNVHTIALHPAFGQLDVKVDPKGADVFIDGQLKGQAPVLLNELPSGPYRLKVTEELYGTFEEQIIIEDGKTSEKSVEISSRFGTLNITGSPKGATISIDGKTVGTIPLKKYKVGTGLIKVEIEAKDHHKYSKSFPVDMNGNYPLKVDLEQYSGRVIAITEPPDAKIYLDGKYRGLSPQILTGVPIGQHKLVFKHSNFLEEVREFNLGLDKRKEFNVKLVTYAGSIEHKISKKRWRRNLSLLASAGFAYWAVNMKNQSDQAYDSYKAGTESDEVTNYYDEASSLQQNSAILWGVAAAALVPAYYSQKSMQVSKQELNLGPNGQIVNPKKVKQNNNDTQVWNNNPKPKVKNNLTPDRHLVNIYLGTGELYFGDQPLSEYFLGETVSTSKIGLDLDYLRISWGAATESIESNGRVMATPNSFQVPTELYIDNIWDVTAGLPYYAFSNSNYGPALKAFAGIGYNAYNFRIVNETGDLAELWNHSFNTQAELGLCFVGKSYQAGIAVNYMRTFGAKYSNYDAIHVVFSIDWLSFCIIPMALIVALGSAG